MTDDFDEVMDGAAAIAIGVYLVIVIYRGNVIPFLNELKKEVGFLEFIVAVYILYRLVKIPTAGPIIGALAAGAILAAVLKASQNFNSTAFTQFANGQISIFTLAVNLTKG